VSTHAIVTAAEFARIAGVRTQTVYRWCDHHGLPALRRTPHLLDREIALRWLAENRPRTDRLRRAEAILAGAQSGTPPVDELEEFVGLQMNPFLDVGGGK
jgi:hypothetical protein